VGVQVRARELNVWEVVTRDFGFSVAVPVAVFSEGRGAQVLRSYLDQLAAADVMATARAKRAGRSPQADDYDMMFASWCVFIPNKPPASSALRDITATVKNRALVGVYLSNPKRDLLEKAMRPVLLEGSKTDLLNALSKVASDAEYNRQVLDTSLLLK
jgi:hypothetical protein